MVDPPSFLLDIICQYSLFEVTQMSDDAIRERLNASKLESTKRQSVIYARVFIGDAANWSRFVSFISPELLGRSK